MTHHFTPRIAAILLIAAGYGWAGGHFIPTNAPFWAYLFQFVMLLLLFVFATGFLSAAAGARAPSAAPAATASPASLPATARAQSTPRGRRNIIGLTIFASLTLVINIANVLRGSSNPGPYGSHNDLADLVPIGLIVAGDILWLLTTIGQPKHNPKKTAEN